MRPVVADAGPLIALARADAAGRRIAQRRGVPVTGVAGVLLFAKAQGAVDAVGPILADMANAGYRLALRLVASVLARAGE